MKFLSLRGSAWLYMVLGVFYVGAFACLGQEQEPVGVKVSSKLRPVITRSDRDGLLLGLDLQLTLGPFELGAGGAYGVVSQAGRFRTSMRYLSALGLSYGDWPTSLVLGRQGEQGVHLTLDLIAISKLLGGVGEGEGFLAEVLGQSRLVGTGFLGRLWPGEGEEVGPEVAYGHLSGFIHWPLPWGFTFEARGEFLFGQPLAAERRPFQTFFSSSRLLADQTTLEVRLGELDNPEYLPGFRFDLGLRSYPGALAGHRFVLASLEQAWDLMTANLGTLDLTGLLGPSLGWIPVHLRMTSSVFFEGGLVLDEEGQQVLFGWGVSLSFPDIDLQLSLAINRQGVPAIRIEAGVLR